MNSSQYDVVVVGAGAAGLTAALGLARTGCTVAVVEAAAFPGAENWSGCVYFCESLAHPDILGEDGVEALAWERRLVERGAFGTDGHGLLGMTYRDPAAFQHCYTVLRPIYDHHLAQVALRHGVALLNETTAESLIREGGKVIGVCTQRGAVYADLVFLAEGDASHLVTREGYERYTDQRGAPKFLQGIKQVIDMPAGAIEEIFGVGAEEGVAYEMLLRNGSLRGQSVHLNMGGFLYTNRQSLSVGLVLPADNLHEHFAGDPNLLMEWFVNLPALRPWLKGGTRGVFGAKIIRGGGAKDIPHLIDDGLAIGGAASAVGIDFPYPNFTGPATLMGLLLARAVRNIRAAGPAQGGFTRDNLRRHYLEPLQQSHYWQDVAFLKSWPAYVKRTTFFFGRNLDLALGTAYIWTRPRRWFLTKWFNWIGLLLKVAGPGHWHEIQTDLRYLTRALRLREVADRPALARFLFDGSVNALRDLFRQPRANVPPAGTIRVHYSLGAAAEGTPEPAGAAPAFAQRWFRRIAPVLASAARRVYHNDATALIDKLPGVFRLLQKQINMLDLLAAGGVGLAGIVTALVLTGWNRWLRLIGWASPHRPPRGLYPRYAQAARQAADLTPVVAAAAQNWEANLAQLAYRTVKASHIHVLWPKVLPDKNAVTDKGLWHVCPAHVYEARVSPQGQLQVVVNFENCIKCETCWRTSDLVSWGRDGQHRFIYPVSSPVVPRLLEAIHAAGVSRPALPKTRDHWESAARALAARLPAAPAENGGEQDWVGAARRLADLLERKIVEFDEALAEEPRTVDRARAEYLEMLARYAQQLAMKIVEEVRGSDWPDRPELVEAHKQLLALAGDLASKAEERSRRTWDQRFAWAAASGRQLRFHHLPGLRHYLNVIDEWQTTGLVRHVENVPPHLNVIDEWQRRAGSGSDRSASDGNARDRSAPVAHAPGAPGSMLAPWLRAEEDARTVADTLAAWSARLDAVLPPAVWRDLERQMPLTSEQDAVLRDLVAQVPLVTASDLSGSLHPPLRKALLAELGRRDPSLAYRVAAHLWSRDLALLVPGSAALLRHAERWARGEEWAAYAAIEAVPISPERWKGEVLFVPALGAQRLLLLVRDQLVVVSSAAAASTEAAPRPANLKIEPLASLGLRGAGLARVRLDGMVLPETRLAVDYDRFRRIWSILSACDLISIAAGMADQLCRRAVAHAASRVQFPGLFHDEEARDTIGKFGAVKKMIAEMEARRYLIETLDHSLSPADFSSPSLESTGLVKAVVAEALGTSPGSVAYNAGQVFGGTGYSEDDILAKFYRDASAWRFLGPANTDIYRKHGQDLLRNWRPDGQRLATLANEGQLLEQVAQRKALQAELDEIRNLRSRIRGVVGDWKGAHKFSGQSPASSGGSEEDDGSASKTSPAGAGWGNEEGSPLATAEIAEALARENAHLLASKALLLRTHARLEQGLNAEIETALVRVWLEDVAVALEKFDHTVRRWLHPAEERDDRPVVEPAAGPPVSRYADYLAASCRYDSGDFLGTTVDLLQPRYVPEMIDSDPVLAANDREFHDLLSGYFGKRPRDDGAASPSAPGSEPYERYIERQHRPDPADLDFCRRHGFFRMPIPRNLGGEGRPKVDYYLLTTNAQRLADVAVSLTIQASTSIGTTPVLLAHDKDLPRAQKDLAAFIGDPALARDIRHGLDDLLKTMAGFDPKRIEQAYRKLQAALEEKIFARTALKVLFHRFAEAWQAAGRAGQAFDLAGMRARTEEARAAWQAGCGQAGELNGELGRRRQACELFLRWVSSGQISAFALTEPSAGSDTARVATRARLRRVPVEVEADGVLRFIPAGSREPRFLLDAQRLEFRFGGSAEGVFYRWSPTQEPARIRFDEYDYETDDPTRTRTYDHGGRRVHFTDVAQLRERDGRLWYDYWELTGAKMWITNGRMSGILCLYAKIDDPEETPWITGVTGFIVDRHAEGLVVGKDEAKMGQCGSPTNELSLQAVRVPRENVIGLEGRGQVNALETLNVGRAGLAMSAMAQMRGLIETSRAFVRGGHGDIPLWAAWRLERMEEDRFSAEALAFEVIGLFEHPQTRSVRMESAISKMLVSELLQRIIETAEDILGLAGQTQLHLVEKRKRDARILNIYEGTNEIQRFFILKDLAGDVAPRWAKTPPAPPSHVSREALELETLKKDLRQRIDAALALFGQQVWQNPSLQANCFLLAEATAWLKAADSTLGRLAWLSRRQNVSEAEHGQEADAAARAESNNHQGDGVQAVPASSHAPVASLARRALARCFAEVRDRLQRFDEELTHLRRGYYATEIHAAQLLFHRAAAVDEAGPPVPARVARITRPLSVLVVVEPAAGDVPHLHVAGGRLLEPYLCLNDADRSALETALRLRDGAAVPITLEVAAVGPRGTAHVLREALSLGFDRVRLILPEAEAVAPDSAAAALAALLRTGPVFDLVLCGGGGANEEEGVLGRLTAGALGVPFAGIAAQIGVAATETEGDVFLSGSDGGPGRVRSLPAAVAVEAGVPLRPFRIEGYLAGLAKVVDTHRWPRKYPAQALTFAAASQQSGPPAAEEQPLPLTPLQAARRLLDKFGHGGPPAGPSSYNGAITDVSYPELFGTASRSSAGGVLAVLAAEPDGRLQTSAVAVLRAARLLAGAGRAGPSANLEVLLLVSPREEIQRRALDQLQEWFQGEVVLLSADAAEKSPELRARLLAECWPLARTHPAPRQSALSPEASSSARGSFACVGEPWTEPAFAALGCRNGTPATLAARVRRLYLEKSALVLETSRARGKLLVRRSLAMDEGGGDVWIALAAEAEVEDVWAGDPGAGMRVRRWSPRLERFYGQGDIQHLLDDLKQETGSARLADADFIVDVGFGVGNRDGYEAVIEPLERTLRALGVRSLVIGGSRKVTEELHLLPADRQIGQSGASVNPQILLAIGISGAPQHVNYIGARAVILAFNRDADAPLMTLNQRQPRPRVFPVVGDLFDTVPALIAALQEERSEQIDPAPWESNKAAISQRPV